MNEAYEVTGFEATTQDDLSIPYLTILQQLSAEINTEHNDHETKQIEGAKIGDVINNVSRKLVHKRGGDPLKFIPCFHKRTFAEYKSEENGGDWVKTHSDSSILEKTVKDEETYKNKLPNGNIVVPTSSFYGLHVEDDEVHSQVVITMKGSQLKKAKGWLATAMGARINGQPAKLRDFCYHLSTVPEAKGKRSWMGWKIVIGEQVDAPKLLTEAKKTAEDAHQFQQRLALPAPKETEIY